ncbi:hypothetical protein [Armatimonas sp.]|uniref:hypothetical protein n=1 Tax=Armatimonas sp. TaxID=1872638 RepID=UPI003751B688
MKLLARTPLLFRAEPRPIASVIFEPRDLWIGCFWDHIKVHQLPYLVVYLAVVPTLVLRLTIPLRGDTP